MHMRTTLHTYALHYITHTTLHTRALYYNTHTHCTTLHTHALYSRTRTTLHTYTTLQYTYALHYTHYTRAHTIHIHYTRTIHTHLLHSAGSLGRLQYPGSYVLVTHKRLHHVTKVKVWTLKVPPGLSPAVGDKDRHIYTTLHTHTYTCSSHTRTHTCSRHAWIYCMEVTHSTICIH